MVSGTVEHEYGFLCGETEDRRLESSLVQVRFQEINGSIRFQNHSNVDHVASFFFFRPGLYKWTVNLEPKNQRHLKLNTTILGTQSNRTKGSKQDSTCISWIGKVPRVRHAVYVLQSLSKIISAPGARHVEGSRKRGGLRVAVEDTSRRWAPVAIGLQHLDN